ncbi:MAG: hypothetical protein JNK16_02355 [Phycisphaerales bacterium]|nr:hypothetical protein [Phycisphaerales bacterium]
MLRRLMCAAATIVATSAMAGNGRIIAIGDEWLVSDLAFATQPAQSKQLTDNIAKFFTDDSPSRMLVWSTSGPLMGSERGVRGVAFANRLHELGHTLDVNPSAPFTLATLRNYRAVFLAGLSGSGSEHAQVLEAYVREGGNVIVMAGTGDIGGAPTEAGQWNYFLNKFGLAFGDTWFVYGSSLITVPTLPSANPLGKLITHVQWGYGQTVYSTQPGNPLVEIAVYGDFTGLTPPPPGSAVQPIIGTVNILTKCLGDLDNNGMVNDEDFVIFVQHYNLLLCEDASMPPACPSDFNADGVVDDVDFTIFIQSYDLPICL